MSDTFLFHPRSRADVLEEDACLTYICSRCGRIMNKIVPSLSVQEQQAFSRSVRECRCDLPKSGMDPHALLTELYQSMQTCYTHEEDLRLVQRLVSQLEMAS